ncbi:MAG: hypothetical protein ABSE55_12690 [Terracidiphilus sp.]|jgi:hypothetical protein
MRTDLTINSPDSLRGFGLCVFAPLAILVAALCGAPILGAQTPATAAPSTPSVAVHKPVHPHTRPIAALAQSPAPQAALSVTPPVPETPAWPANAKPDPATVTWDSHGLRIEAANSSLSQILEDVSTATGTKVEGFDADQRIFGVYGPGPARDVLSQLLQGSGYNVLLVGEQGQGTPREIVLSARHAGSTAQAPNAAPANASDEDVDTEEPPQPQPGRPAIQPSIAPGGPARTPQQIQEMQQRLQGPPQPGQQVANPQN